jgi:hypothetical protein
MDLGFRVETIDGARVKVRDDGRRGYCVADEAALWDELQKWKGAAEGELRRRQELGKQIAERDEQLAALRKQSEPKKR